MALPTGTRPLPHQSSVKKVHHRLLHRPIWWRTFSQLRFHLPRESSLCQVGMKLASTPIYKAGMAWMTDGLSHSQNFCTPGSASAVSLRFLLHVSLISVSFLLVFEVFFTAPPKASSMHAGSKQPSLMSLGHCPARSISEYSQGSQL